MQFYRKKADHLTRIHENRKRDVSSVGEIRRSLQEATMGVSGQGDKPLSPKTQKNDDDNSVRKIINKSNMLYTGLFVCDMNILVAV